MGEDIKDVRTAAIKFLNTMEHAVDITLVDFDTEVRVARYASSDYARLIERIRSRKPDGYTALYDALGLYLNGAAMQDGQKVRSCTPTAATRAARSTTATSSSSSARRT